MRVSEVFFVSYYVLSEEWELFENFSEIRVNRIRVNQGLGVQFWHFLTKLHHVYSQITIISLQYVQFWQKI